MLIRKSDGALAKLALSFDRNHFEVLFNGKKYGLLNFIQKHAHSSDEEGLKQARNGLMALAHIVKATNPEMKQWARHITEICINIIEEYKDKDIFP